MILIPRSISKHFSTLQEAERTALMFAAEDGNTEVVKLLISAGADVNIRDKVRNLSSRSIYLLHQSWVFLSMQNGVTAADIAEASGHKDLSKELMAHSLSPQDVRHNEDDVSYSSASVSV